MKKLILISLCLFAAAVVLHAQNVQYLIDNELVEQFDGSPLKGKTIRDYKISTSGTGRNALIVHAITTAPSVFSFPVTFSADTLIMRMPHINEFSGSNKIVYVIDGEVADESAFRALSPLSIGNVKVLRRDSPEARVYGENVAVIQIQTKEVDQELLDKLKKIPGVKVDADGKVTANGEPVNKITVVGGTGKTVHP